MSDLAAIAVGNAREYEQTKRRLDEISTLHDISVAATSSLDFSEITRRTVQTLQRLLGFEYIALFLADEEREHIDLYATSGLEAEVERNPHIRLGVGIVGWVAANGQSLNVPDVLEEPRHLAGISVARSELCVPLRVNDRVIGALDLQSARAGAFSAADEQLLSTVATQLAVILENARLYATERRRRQQLEGLQSTASAIGAELELNALLNLIVQEAAHTFESPAVSLLMWNDSIGQLSVQASRGLSANFVSQAVYPREQVGWPLEPAIDTGVVAAGTMRPHVVHDLQSDLIDLEQRRLYLAEDLRSLLRVALISGGRPVGVLDIYSQQRPRRFTPEEIELAHIFASQVAVAIENARLYAETRRRLDEVTILYEVARSAAATLDLNLVFDRLLDAIQRTLRYENFEFILYEPTTGMLNTRAAYGFSPIATALDLQLGEGIVGYVARTGTARLLGDVTQAADFLSAQPGTRSELAVPMRIGERFIGVINVESSRLNAFT
ncbi:MAG TPA: GAF domain-containing protein, partial [Anaerolineae bacterium]